MPISNTGIVNGELFYDYFRWFSRAFLRRHHQRKYRRQSAIAADRFAINAIIKIVAFIFSGED